MVADTESDILQRVLDTADAERLTPQAARALLTLTFTEEDNRRVSELAEKANEGQLTADERLEYERYVRVSLLLVRLKSKCRLALRDSGATEGTTENEEAA